MATKKGGPTYRCSECGWTTVKWVGRCGECQAWGSVDEVGGATTRTLAAARVQRPAVPIREIDGEQASHRSTGVPDFDRVLGGGLVPGSVVLVAGEPGIGKSRIVQEIFERIAGERVAVIGAGGIGFDVSEFLVTDESPSLNLKEWEQEWGVTEDGDKPGFVTKPRPLPAIRQRAAAACRR